MLIHDLSYIQNSARDDVIMMEIDEIYEAAFFIIIE